MAGSRAHVEITGPGNKDLGCSSERGSNLASLFYKNVILVYNDVIK